MNNKVLYQHRRKDDNSIFYVGIGYLQRASSIQNRNRWWRNIVAKCSYDIEILEVGLTWEEATKKEIELIAKLGRKDLGKGLLVNLTDGGDGSVGYKHTPESLDKISKSKIGNKNCLGKIASDETRQKMSLSRLGTKQSEVHINKRIEKRKGKKMPEGSLAKSWETRRLNKMKQEQLAQTTKNN